MLTRDRIRRYPLIRFGVTVGLYLTGLARSRGWVEPNGQIVGRDYLAFYMVGDIGEAMDKAKKLREVA